jgi:hypothetical protein
MILFSRTEDETLFSYVRTVSCSILSGGASHKSSLSEKTDFDAFDVESFETDFIDNALRDAGKGQ